MDATSASSSPIEENYFMMSTGIKPPLKLFLNFRNFSPIRVEPPPEFFSISSEIARAATSEGSDASQEDLLWAVTVVVINLAVTYKAMIRNKGPWFIYTCVEPDYSICFYVEK